MNATSATPLRKLRAGPVWSDGRPEATTVSCSVRCEADDVGCEPARVGADDRRHLRALRRGRRQRPAEAALRRRRDSRQARTPARAGCSARSRTPSPTPPTRWRRVRAQPPAERTTIPSRLRRRTRADLELISPPYCSGYRATAAKCAARGPASCGSELLFVVCGAVVLRSARADPMTGVPAPSCFALHL